MSPEEESGERMGRSLGGGLKALVDAKLSQMYKQAGLAATLGNPKQAEAMSYLPNNILNSLVRSNRTSTYTNANRGSFGSSKIDMLVNLKKNIKSINPELLSNLGLSKMEHNILTATKLNDNLVDYFLKKSSNDPIKAEKLARKFGFEV